MSDSPSDNLRIHSLWACVVLVVALLSLDGLSAVTAASAVIAILGGIAGYGYGLRAASPPS